MSSEPLAALPMYDWPEVRAANDDLWSSIRTRLHDRGVPGPERLTRHVARETIWTSDDMIVSQTCGLPFISGVDQHAAVLGTFGYDIEGCEQGDYNSAIVVRADHHSQSIDDLRGKRVARNSAGSQSGCAALMAVVAPNAVEGRFFSEVVEAGTHRNSIRAVAHGDADVAAVDAVSWALALDHDMAAKELRVLTRTPCTPGLPLITSRRNLALRPVINEAISDALCSLDNAVLGVLHISGFRPRTDAEYSVIRDRLDSAIASGYPVLA